MHFMRTYNLAAPKDGDGQPIQIFKANLENNLSKAIDQLSGICAGVRADDDYDRKIECSVEWRESGSGLGLVSEEHWKRFIS